MNLDIYDGLLLFAQPVDRSERLAAYICVGYKGDTISLVAVEGGILSGQVRIVTLSDQFWQVVGSMNGDDTIATLINSLTAMLTNPSLALEIQARTEARTTREILVHTLQRSRNRLRVLERAAEDAGLVADRQTEDEVAKQVFTSLLQNPNPEAEEPNKPFSQGAYVDAPPPQITISISHQDPEVRAKLSEQIAEKLRKKE